jgi:hypothetical protein
MEDSYSMIIYNNLPCCIMKSKLQLISNTFLNTWRKAASKCGVMSKSNALYLLYFIFKLI